VVAGWHGPAARRGGRRPSCTLLEQSVPGKPGHSLANADVRDPAARGTGSVPRGAPRGGGPLAELMPSPAGGLPCNPAELAEVWVGGRAHVSEAIGPPVGTVAGRPGGDSLDLMRARMITLTRGGGSPLSAGIRTKVSWHRAPSNRSLGRDGYADIWDSVSSMFARSMFVTSHSGHTNFDALSAFQEGTSNARHGRPKWRRRVTAGMDPNPSDQEGT
jgi:hypothetical protein